MADLIATYRIPEAKVKPLADAIRKSESPEEDEDGNPIIEADEVVIDRSVITHLQSLDLRYRRRNLSSSAELDTDIVSKEP